MRLGFQGSLRYCYFTYKNIMRKVHSFISKTKMFFQTYNNTWSKREVNKHICGWFEILRFGCYTQHTVTKTLFPFWVQKTFFVSPTKLNIIQHAGTLVQSQLHRLVQLSPSFFSFSSLAVIQETLKQNCWQLIKLKC